jgi:hypothetical protein
MARLLTPLQRADVRTLAAILRKGGRWIVRLLRRFKDLSDLRVTHALLPAHRW